MKFYKMAFVALRSGIYFKESTLPISITSGLFAKCLQCSIRSKKNEAAQASFFLNNLKSRIIYQILY